MPVTAKRSADASQAADKTASTVLAAAKGYIAKATPLMTKIAQGLRTTTSMTESQKTAAVGAFRTAFKAAHGHRNAVRLELRSSIRQAADGDEISDDYADAAEALSAIMNLAETALDSLDENVDDATADADKGAEDGDDDTEKASDAEASDKEASDKEASDKEASDKEASEDDDGADKKAKREASAADVVANANAAILEAAAPAAASAPRRAGGDALQSLLEGLKDLISSVEDSQSGVDDTVVNLDENGVVQDDPSVSDILNEDPSQVPDVPGMGDDQGLPADPYGDDGHDDLHAALSELEAAGAGMPFMAAADPYTRPSKDPLADKGAIKANATRRASQQDNQFNTDVHNLSLIANELIR